MIKQLIIFLIMVVVLVAGATYYHISTPSPFHNSVFTGSGGEPASEPSK